MNSRFRHVISRVVAGTCVFAWALVSATALVAPAQAAVEVRVESRPASDPVEAYVKVTTNTGVPVSGLTAANFEVLVDGSPIAIGGGFTLPPGEPGSVQRVSVVFVMDYSGTVQSTALAALETAVKDFVNNAMQPGDEAAIIKFNASRGATVVQEFLAIDGPGNPNNVALETAVDAGYSGTGSPILDALALAVNQFVTPPHALPAGPKAIILVSDGGENQSGVTESEVVALANENSIPIFTIGVGDVSQPGRSELMQGLGDETGGLYYPPEPGDTHIEEAYGSIAELLSNEYLITFEDGITDCATHTLEVRVDNQAPVTVSYTRRTCDTEPNPFSFTAQTGLEPSATATSNTVTITGLSDGVPAQVSVIQGSYSIGCGATFTTNPGTIADGSTVCVRQQASASFSTSQTTTLTIGGVAGTFTTTTRSGGGGGGGGGGGAAGILELLLLAGLGAFLFRRRLAI